MPDAIYTFPRGFLWGTATASHQVEGNNNNNWTKWENTPGRIVEDQKSGLACDWWGGRWKEDFERAFQAGQNAHRFSLEWSRIQPTADTWDDDALNQYVEMACWLVDHHMTPLVTLHHFSDPLWFCDEGGWENQEAPALFARYVRRVIPALKDYVTLWVTINEPNVYVLSGWIAGDFPPGKHNLKLASEVVVNLIRGHAAAYHLIHELQPEAQVGIATNYRSFLPERRWFPPDRLSTHLLDQLVNRAFNDCLASGKLDLVFRKCTLPQAASTQDFIGLNYYTRDMVTFDLRKPGEMFSRRSFPPDAEVSPTGFLANVPQGFWDGLKWAHSYQLPILVTENGVEDAQDSLRPRYLVEHLHQLWRAATFNWRIKGYFHWSLVDNFEWERGWTQRFGLWGLDVNTQERIRRESADIYESICKENGISSTLVATHLPQLMEKLFPSD